VAKDTNVASEGSLGDREQRVLTVDVGQASAPSSGSNGGGIFDGGLATYRTVTQDDYRALLTSGLVVLDTNALLDLYRYHAKTRKELIDALSRLEDRLWIPHHVMYEFFERRQSVIASHSKEIGNVVAGLNKSRVALEEIIQAWSNRAGFPQGRTTELIDAIEKAVEDVVKKILELSADDAFEHSADTAKDPVITALSSILEGRVGHPLPTNELLEAKATAKKRIIDKVAPGWRDANKRDNPEGDYLIWYQTLQEAKGRAVDVLLVTGDIKDDWWRKEHGEVKGPLPELVHEMQTVANVRLFMLRPESLLVHAANILGVSVSQESVQDAERVSSRASVAYNVARAQAQLYRAAENFLRTLRVLQSNGDGGRTNTHVSGPAEELVAAQGRSAPPEMLDAVWVIINAGIDADIFGGTASWSPSSHEQEAWTALDALYIAAVQCWLESAVERHTFEIGDHPRESFDQGPFPPRVLDVQISFAPEELKGHQRVQFDAMITDGRQVSIRRVYGMKRA
jgi:hypothetical protein